MPDLLGVLDSARKLLVEYRPLSGYILLLYGLVECYIGSRYFRYFMGVTGFFLAVFIGSWLPTQWIEMDIVRYLVIAFLGTGIGALFYYSRYTRIIMKGVLVFLILGTGMLHLFRVTPNNMLLIGMSSLGGLIYFIADRGTRIVGLSLVGSFLLLYGYFLSWGWSTYKDMSFVFNMSNVDSRLFGVLFLWILLFSTGVMLQTKLTT